jgi:hypothetical protein
MSSYFVLVSKEFLPGGKTLKSLFGLWPEN